MGHMHKVRKNLRSTQEMTTEETMEEKEEDEDYLPPKKIKNREHIVQVTAMKFEVLKGISSSNQTGTFPHMLGRGNRV